MILFGKSSVQSGVDVSGIHIFWLVSFCCSVRAAVQSQAYVTGATSNCLCDLQGTRNPSVCVSKTCDCKVGYTGSTCSICQVGFFRSSNEDACQPCDCNKHGSQDVHCSSSGQCTCNAGVHGLKCDQCQPGYYLSGQGSCLHCDCHKTHLCMKGNADVPKDKVCISCVGELTKIRKCNICGHHQRLFKRNGTYVCSTYSALSSMAGQFLTGDPTFDPPRYQHVPHISVVIIYACVGGFFIIVLAVFALTILLRRRRIQSRHPANFPFWTVELRREDQNALQDANDVDVMYLDDTYLMGSPEIFSSGGSETGDERLRYQPLR